MPLFAERPAVAVAQRVSQPKLERVPADALRKQVHIDFGGEGKLRDAGCAHVPGRHMVGVGDHAFEPHVGHAVWPGGPEIGGQVDPRNGLVAGVCAAVKQHSDVARQNAAVPCEPGPNRDLGGMSRVGGSELFDTAERDAHRPAARTRKVRRERHLHRGALAAKVAANIRGFDHDRLRRQIQDAR